MDFRDPTISLSSVKAVLLSSHHFQTTLILFLLAVSRFPPPMMPNEISTF
jgi:hypothetical protein